MSKTQRVMVRIVMPAVLGCLAGLAGVVLGMMLAAVAGAVRGWHKPRGFERWEGAVCLGVASGLTAGLLGAMCWLVGWPLALPWSAIALWCARTRREDAVAVAV